MDDKKNKLIPVRGSVVCRKISGGDCELNKAGLKIKTQGVDEYEITNLPLVEPEKCPFRVGDRVISNSTGDAIETNPGETVYMFKIENLMCKVEDDNQA